MPVLEALAINLIAAGVTGGVKDGKEKVRKLLRQHRYGVEDLPAEFNEALRSEIKQLNQRRQNQLLESLVENWEEVATELDDISVAFDSEERAIDEITRAILTSDAAPVDADPSVDQQIREAVTKSYQDAARKFRSRITGTQLSEQLDKEADIKIIEELNALATRLDGLLGPRYYDIFDPVSEREQAIEQLPLERDFEFVGRPELNRIKQLDRVLITGRAGSGKTRLLAETVRQMDTETVETILVPDHSALKHISQLDVLEQEDFQGDVLLVWDDIHRITEREDNEVFEHLVSRLQALLDEDDNELRVLATARSGSLSKLPGQLPSDFTNPDSFWYSFEEVRLEDERLSKDDLESIANAYAQHLERELDDELAGRIATKAKSVDPSPFYVVSALNAVAGEDTITKFEELPDKAVDIWKYQFESVINSDAPAWGVLRSLKLLDEFDLPPYAALVKGIYLDVLECQRPAFDQAVESLARERSWISVSDRSRVFADTTQYELHDVQLAAIDDGPNRHLRQLSEFFLNELSWYLPRAESALDAQANRRFGNWLRAHHPEQFREVAQEHYQKAVEVGDSWECYKLLAELEFVNEEFEKAETHYLRANELNSESTVEPSNWALSEIDATPAATNCLCKLALKLGSPSLFNHCATRFTSSSSTDALQETFVSLLNEERVSKWNKRRMVSFYTKFVLQSDSASASFKEIWSLLNEDRELWTGHISGLRKCGDVEALKHAVDEAIDRGVIQQRAIRRTISYLMEEGHPETAEEYFSKGLDLISRENSTTRAEYRLLKKYAESLVENNEPDHAREIFDRIDWTEQVKSASDYADFLLENYGRDEADTFFSRVAEQSPKARKQYAEWLADHGMLEGWREQFIRVLDDHPEASSASLKYGEILASHDEAEDARNKYQQLIERATSDTIGPLRLGYVKFLIESGLEDKAKTQIDHMSKDDMDLLLSSSTSDQEIGSVSGLTAEEIADLLMDAGEFERAEERLHDIIEQKREKPFQEISDSLRQRLVRSLLENGRYEPAQTYLEEMLNDDAHPPSFELIRDLLVETGHQDLIEPLLQQADLSDQSMSEALLTFSEAFLAKGDPEKAERMIERAIELDPNSDRGRTRLGLLLLREGEFERAIRQIETSQAAQENLYSYAALMKLLEGEPNLAEDYLDEAAKTEDINADVCLTIGNIYTLLEEFEKAGEQFERAVELAPQNESVQTRYAEYLHEERKVEAAEAHFQKACSGGSPSPDSLARYTIFLVRENRSIEAREHLEQALKNGENKLYVQLAAANVHFDAGDLERVETPLNTFINELSLSKLEGSLHWLSMLSDLGVLLQHLARGAPEDAHHFTSSVIDKIEKESPENTEQEIASTLAISILEQTEQAVITLTS